MTRWATIKGIVHLYYMGDPRKRLQLRNTVCFKPFNFSVPLAGMADVMVSLLLLKNYFGQSCDTIKSTVATRGIKTEKNS